MMSPFRVILRPVVGLAESIVGRGDFVMVPGCGHPWSRASVSGLSIPYVVNHLATFNMKFPILHVDLH